MDFICSSKDDFIEYEFSRRQFPVQLAYAISIHQAQGQTMDKLGIYLSKPLSSHGELYVAFSRVRRKGDLKICIRESTVQGTLGQTEKVFTKNIVHKEMF